MKVLVIGTGSVGAVLCKLLANDKRVGEVVCCDIVEREKFKSKKIRFFKIDLKQKNVFYEFLKKINPDVVVNAATPLLNIKILEACFRTNLNYLDLAAQWDPNPNKKAKSPYKIEQFDYDKKFKKSKLKGLIMAGVTPGLDNLFAKQVSEKLDKTETIKIRLFDYSGTEELSFFWSKEALLDELNSKPLIYEKGRFKIMEPFSGIEEFDFPSPFNKKKVNLICQEEIGTIPFFINVKNVDIKDYDNQFEMQKLLYSLGLTSKKNIKFGKAEISPIDFSAAFLPDIVKDITNKKYDNAQFAFAVRAEGGKNRKKQIAQYFIVFPKQKEINKLKFNANFITYPTALCAKLFVMIVPKIKKYGVFPPEALDAEIRKEVLEELKKNKIKVEFRKQFK